MARILLGVTGGIAAYKACELLRLLMRAGHDVFPLVTASAERVPGGFRAVLDEMEAEAPKIIALTRMHGVWHRDEFFQWAAEHYEKLPMNFAHDAVFVRRPSP